jgi:DNA-binding NarL/FixJ family response regulator
VGAVSDVEATFAAAVGSRFLVIASAGSSSRPPRWVLGHPHAVVSKNGSFQDLLCRLEMLFSDSLQRDGSADDSFRHRPLTDQEAEVVALMGEGFTTRQIAEMLGRSIFTIQTHRKRIAEKLGRIGGPLSQRAFSHRSRHYPSTRQGH